MRSTTNLLLLNKCNKCVNGSTWCNAFCQSELAARGEVGSVQDETPAAAVRCPALITRPATTDAVYYTLRQLQGAATNCCR